MTKKDYEIAAEAFREVDAAYRELEAKFMDGTILQEIIPLDGSSTMDDVVTNYKKAMSHLKSLRDNRNSRLITAKSALRQAVILGESQWRGPGGKATIIDVNEFSVSSVTRRKFDGPTLVSMASEKGVLDELLKLRGIDKNGKEFSLIQQDWKIDYEGIAQWLTEHDFLDIYTAAYDEVESTPMVKGPKLAAFLGENKE